MIYDLVKSANGEELQTQLAALGWDVEVVTTEWAFVFGMAESAPDRTRSWGRPMVSGGWRPGAAAGGLSGPSAMPRMRA